MSEGYGEPRVRSGEVSKGGIESVVAAAARQQGARKPAVYGEGQVRPAAPVRWRRPADEGENGDEVKQNAEKIAETIRQAIGS